MHLPPHRHRTGMINVCAISLLFCAGAAFAQQHDAKPASAFAGHRVYRVEVNSQQTLLQGMSLADDVWNCRPGVGPLDLQVSPDKVNALEEWAAQQGLPLRVLIPDVQALIERERAAPPFRPRGDEWFTQYHPLTEIHARLDHLAGLRPDLASTFVAGQTLEGRAMKGIRLTGPDLPGNPRAARPQVLFNGAQHAREWITPPMNMYIAQQFIQNYGEDPRITAILDSIEIVIIPVVNADGYEFSWLPNNRLWRKNRRNNGNNTFGVDLNRNWGYQWGGEGASTNTNNQTYRGTGPFSEPETQVLRDFIISLPRLVSHIDFHSYSQLILSPWGYTSTLCPDEPLFADLNDMMARSIFDVHGKVYVGGPGYTTIYPASGVIPDWVYGERGVLSWTYELRDTGQFGFVLPPEQIIPNCEEAFAAVLDLCEFSALPLQFSLPLGLPQRAQANEPGVIRVAVRTAAAATLDQHSVTIYARAGTDDSFVPAQAVGEFAATFAAPLPAGDCGSAIELRFSADTTDGRRTWYPSADGAFSIPIETVFQTFHDDMESDRGWVVGHPTDTATRGIWERAIPQATAAQPGGDVTEGGQFCFVTDGRAGSSLGEFDVDDGATTLTSPAFAALPPPATRVSETRVSYWRWYSNNTGSSPNADTFLVLISNDDGQTWTTLEQTGENAGRWVYRSFRVEDFVQPSNAMKLRFVASDFGAGSIVEAAIDEVELNIFGCLRSGDVNRDGGVDGADVEVFFLAWQAGEPLGDFNEDGGVDGADVEEFFIAWERGG
ncbi:MAG: hypothetical protein KF864_03105 [Phycisphaeraceae bacterium]|nr:hypothetical protein [Phycisphaeraceae bacterium]